MVERLSLSAGGYIVNKEVNVFINIQFCNYIALFDQCQSQRHDASSESPPSAASR